MDKQNKKYNGPTQIRHKKKIAKKWLKKNPRMLLKLIETIAKSCPVIFQGLHLLSLDGELE